MWIVNTECHYWIHTLALLRFFKFVQVSFFVWLGSRIQYVYNTEYEKQEQERITSGYQQMTVSILSCVGRSNQYHQIDSPIPPPPICFLIKFSGYFSTIIVSLVLVFLFVVLCVCVCVCVLTNDKQHDTTLVIRCWLLLFIIIRLPIDET